MSAFLQQAEQILETARRGGMDDCRLSILLGWDGGIHIISASDWGLEPLRMHHGARAAYRVTRRRGCVQLEGRAADGSCILQSSAVASRLCTDFPQYRLA